MKTQLNHQTILLVILGFIFLVSVAAAQVAGPIVYIGTYTNAGSKGVYAYRMDSKTGSLTSLGLAAETPNPTFLAIHPNGRFLYTANEIGRFNGKPSGAISAFAIDPKSGMLQLINQQPSGGGGPCHLIVDKAGKHVLAANYGGGSITVLPVDADGKLGEATAFVQHTGSSVNPQRQKEPHAHGIYLDAANRFAFVADLGLDKVLSYRFDTEKGTLSANTPPGTSVKPGAGPRHFTFDPSGRYAYVINELDSTITAFSYDSKDGVLTELQTLTTLPKDFDGKSYPAEIEVHPSGKFLYGSNRGHDSIALYSIDSRSGKLTFVDHQATQGKSPRNFGIDPSGKHLLAANQGSDNVVVFRIDPKTGRLSPTGQTIQVAAPVCVKFLSAK